MHCTVDGAAETVEDGAGGTVVDDTTGRGRAVVVEVFPDRVVVVTPSAVGFAAVLLHAAARVTISAAADLDHPFAR